MTRRVAIVLAAALAVSASIADAQTFDFETTPAGTAVPLSITSGGLTATFTSGAGFSVQPAFFSSALSGLVLRDDDPAMGSLTVAFSSPVTGILLNFATNSPLTPAGLTLEARDGATVVGSVSVPGVVPPGFLFPEGLVSFTGPTFTSVVLSSSARDFAVDNLVLTAATAVIPEPGTLLLFGTGALLVGASALRRRRLPS